MRTKLSNGHRRDLRKRTQEELGKEGPASCMLQTGITGDIILYSVRVDFTILSPQENMGSNIPWDLASEQAESWVGLEADIPPVWWMGRKVSALIS